MTIDQEKKRLRIQAWTRRAEAARAAGPGAADRFKDVFVNAMTAMGIPGPGAAISGYWPLFGKESGEMDMQALMTDLDSLGYVCALPVVVGRDKPLIFRRWRPGISLDIGPFSTQHPGSSEPEVRPDVLLVPLLAFDGDGYRLGYGGGYYDRTLDGLKGGGSPIAVGAAFAGQRVDQVPHDAHDQPMDWIVTEERVMKMGEAS